MGTLRLGVNVDHVATLRQVRKARYPDPVLAASLAELAGAAQITVHLREDRRHIQERDLRLLREQCQTALNLEMAATGEMAKLAYEYKPDLVTLVPERREELTTEGGLDVVTQREGLTKLVKALKDAELPVSLFIDPNVEQVRAAHRCGVDRVELHTGRYCEARAGKAQAQEWTRVVDAAKAAHKLNLGVGAGHGLNYDNVADIARIEEIDELNIGHAIVARAVMVGFERAVRDMLSCMREARA